MDQANKTKLIQYLQLLHSDWLVTFSKKLSQGTCVEEMHMKNMQIHYMLRVLYRYYADEDLAEDDTQCLTLDELNDIVCRVKSLLENCNC